MKLSQMWSHGGGVGQVRLRGNPARPAGKGPSTHIIDLRPDYHSWPLGIRVPSNPKREVNELPVSTSTGQSRPGTEMWGTWLTWA